MSTNNITELVRQDINDWIVNFVEASNEFYGHKFPVCPYARAARLRQESTVCVYESGSIREFIWTSITDNLLSNKYKVILCVLPPRAQWLLKFDRYVAGLNKKIIPHDLYALLGQALGTISKYPGLLNSGPYCVLGVNKLSAVLPAVESLKSAGYYDNWSDQHYKDIVELRQQSHEKYSKKDSD